MSRADETAAAIRAGDTGRMPELWEQVRRYVYKQAGRYYRRFSGAYGVCMDELINSGYIAVTEAVRSYDPAAGAFVAWVSLYLQSAFLQVYGFRGSGSDALPRACSLDAPIASLEDTTLAEMIPDPTAAGAIEAVDAEIDNACLRAVLERCLSELPERQCSILRSVYFCGKSQEALAEQYGCTGAAICQQKRKALRKLYEEREENGLGDYMDTHTNFFEKASVKRFNSTGESVVEALVFKRERLAERWIKRFLRNQKDK